MSTPHLIATIAVLTFIGFTIVQAVRSGPPGPNTWMAPLAASLGFFTFSAVTIATEGPVGFWTEHVRDLWGNQIWIDLLLAALISWSFLVPRLRRLGLSPWPWLLLVYASGSVGLLAVWAKILYAESRGTAPAAAADPALSLAPRG